MKTAFIPLVLDIALSMNFPEAGNLEEISIPTNAYKYGIYVSRGFDLNSKIVLFNSLLGSDAKANVLSTILNPYFLDKYDAEYDPNTKGVCFGGVDSKRCLVTFKKMNIKELKL